MRWNCDEIILWQWIKEWFKDSIYVTGKIMNKEAEKGKSFLLKKQITIE